MPSVNVVLFKSTLLDGAGNTYPVFTGFLPAATLVGLSVVPAFTDATTHSEIGSNVNGNPVEKWQRPEIPGKIAAISERFGHSGEVMPNPVLLASLTALSPTVLHTAADGTQMVEAELGATAGSLIILDGQHRIKGLAAIRGRSHVVPFVLLADVGSQSYNRSMYARIFAEVTTQSSELDKLHDAWLRYAFELDNYEPQGSPPVATPDHHAMASVTQLVSWNPNPPVANAFLDRVKLNPVRSLTAPIHQGFAYDAISLSALINEGYYSNPARTTTLSDFEVAENLSHVVNALSKVCTTAHERSVFFGSVDFRQRPMEDGFLLGALHYLAVNGVPGDWQSLLRVLKFDSANWNFKSWVARLDGNTGGRSRILAKRVLTEAFEASALPPGVTDIPTHLKGDGAKLTLTFTQMSPGGRSISATAVTDDFPITRMGVHPLTAGTDYKMTLTSATSSIERLVAWDIASPRDEVTRSRLERQGMLLQRTPSDAREVHFKVEYYGGVEETFKLTVNW
jgi:hypothetical protein